MATLTMIFIDCDDAEKSTLSHTASRVRNNTCKTKRKDLTKSIGVVPAKYPPKVKLELLTTLECQSWGELCTLVSEDIGAFIVVKG